MLLRAWATQYGSDGRMKDYEAAAKELLRAEEKLQLQRQASSTELKHVAHCLNR